MGRRYFSVFGMALALAFVLAACGSSDEDELEPTVTRIPDAANAPVLTPDGGGSPVAVDQAGTPAADDADASPASADGSPVPVDGTPAAGTPGAAGQDAGTTGDLASTIEIVSLDILFEPDALTIPADTAVVVSLPNEGASPHNFSIDELEISVDQAPGEVQEVEINAPAGVYEYYCNVPAHREAGMVGTLTVE